MALTETKNLNAKILKKYWKLMKHANLCTIGGFQCLLVNVEYGQIAIDTWAHTKYKKVNISFAKWWCLYRNCHLDFVIFYFDTRYKSSYQPVEITSIDPKDITIAGVRENNIQEFIVYPVTMYIHPNRLIKNLIRQQEIEYIHSNNQISRFRLNPEFNEYTIKKISPIGPIDYKIPIFNRITEPKESHKLYIKFKNCEGVLGNFVVCNQTADVKEFEITHYEYNNEYMWYHLNHLLRQNVKYEGKDCFLTSQYTFPRRDAMWRPIVNRGINDMNPCDLMKIGFDAVLDHIRTKSNNPDLYVDAQNVVLTYPNNQPTEKED